MNASLILLPTYCESDTLPEIVDRLSAFDRVDVLVIDDSSPDGTGELAEDLKRRYARLSVLHRVNKEGLGRAYAHGFREALRRGYRQVVTMDADLSHAPEDVPRLLEVLGRADVAVGSRHVPGGGVEDWPLSRHLLSHLGSLYARTLLRLPVRDLTGGFRAYRAQTLEDLDLQAIEARGFLFQVEVLRRVLDLPGTRALEVPIVFRNRRHGQSKLSRDIVFEALGGVLKLRRRKRPSGETGGRDRRREDSPHSESTRPLVSIIVPRPPGSGMPRALRAIERLDYPTDCLEVLVTEGRAPSRQRNRAVRASRGEYLLFLDDDSEPEGDLLSRYVDLLERRPGVAAVGGPAEGRAGATEFQELSHAVLSERWVIGKTASRYRARGELRASDERELILFHEKALVCQGPTWRPAAFVPRVDRAPPRGHTPAAAAGLRHRPASGHGQAPGDGIRERAVWVAGGFGGAAGRAPPNGGRSPPERTAARSATRFPSNRPRAPLEQQFVRQASIRILGQPGIGLDA